MTAPLPLLFLDVDGPLNPYAAKPHRRPVGYRTHRLRPEGWIAQHPTSLRAYVKPLRVWLNPAHGPALLALADRFELVWATTWEADANEWIGPLLGLPQLPVVTWPTLRETSPDGTFWKTPCLVKYAAGRPFAWVDDDIGPADHRFVAAHHSATALLRRTDPRLGLLETDFTALAAFAQNPGAIQGAGLPATPRG
ncbi:HAD domain-containing protein [Streptomyces xanthochromogenes]|uniref:Secreted protein n=1 Tax=Streptomyces xanthochromogenes TaxID=67384 RepID=A0ABQ2ZGD8_9ACTN|nr:hypothetical protein [Streptomyces xanthochromogenes]GGY15819.1 hypothetical protein GCM10010326_04540 [Streptomyces xanthochromogenes]